MARRLRYSQKRTESSEYALISGDRVIVKNSQYISKTGKGKYQCKDGALREFRVVSVQKGIVEVEEIGTGARMLKHESHLKVMPRVVPGEEEGPVENFDDDSAPTTGKRKHEGAHISRLDEVVALPVVVRSRCLVVKGMFYRCFDVVLSIPLSVFGR